MTTPFFNEINHKRPRWNRSVCSLVWFWLRATGRSSVAEHFRLMYDFPYSSHEGRSNAHRSPQNASHTSRVSSTRRGGEKMGSIHRHLVDEFGCKHPHERVRVATIDEGVRLEVPQSDVSVGTWHRHDNRMSYRTSTVLCNGRKNTLVTQ